jgi:hypothetical protein
MAVPSTFRQEFEAWWDALDAEGQRTKNSYRTLIATIERLDALSADAPERAWIHEILLDWVASDDERRWDPAVSLLKLECAPGAPEAFRAAAASATTKRKRDEIDSFLEFADELEGQLSVPLAYREQFETWWDARPIQTDANTWLGESKQDLRGRLEGLPQDAPERAWFEQLMIEWLSSEDMGRWLPALQYLWDERLEHAIAPIRQAAYRPYTDEKTEAVDVFYLAADEIAEVAGYPEAFDDPTAYYTPEVALPRAAGARAWSGLPPRVLESISLSSRRDFEVRFEIYAARGRRARDPREADRTVGEWLDEEQHEGKLGRMIEVLIDWLDSPDPWRWHVALSQLGRHRIRAAIEPMLAAVEPPNTEDKARWAPAFVLVAAFIDGSVEPSTFTG